MILALIEEAVTHGARRSCCSELLGVSARMIERWRSESRRGKDEDARHVSLHARANARSSCQIVWKRASGGELFSGWFDGTNPVVVFGAGINLG